MYVYRCTHCRTQYVCAHLSNSLHNTATYRNLLQHTATYCNKLQRYSIQFEHAHLSSAHFHAHTSLHHTSSHCIALQYYGIQCVDAHFSSTPVDTRTHMHTHSGRGHTHMGWLRLVGSLKLSVSFAEYSLFYRALLQKIPIILRSLLIMCAMTIRVCAMARPFVCDDLVMCVP